MPITSRFVVRSTVTLLIVGLVTLLAIVGMSFWLGERAQTYFDEVIEARDARAAAGDLRDAVQKAESAQRGFIATGNEIYLAPYSTSKTAAERALKSVQDILAPYPEAKAPVERLVVVINEKFAEMDETIALKRERRDDEALAAIRSNRGKALMDEANIFFSGLIGGADERLTLGVTEQRTNATWLRWLTIIGGIVIIAVVGGAALAVIRYTRELAAARDEVTALNAGLEIRVSERTADLARANDEIQRFAYIVTHDLRAPLVNIMGFTSELEASVASLQALIEKSGAGKDISDPVVREARTAATEDLPEAIGFIRSSTKKMDDLINAILKLSREGRRELRGEPVKLGEIVERSIAAIKHQVADAGGMVDIAGDLPTIVSDRLALESVFGNILDNAVKYRAAGRPLRITVRDGVAPAGTVAVEIEDNGRGIAEQDLERVFELFRRAGVQDQPGEGIGLAYVRNVVRKLGGDVTVTSVLGTGTTFRVTLPRILTNEEGAAP